MTSVNKIFSEIQHILTYFYVWVKYAYFDVFYNGYERKEQLWLQALFSRNETTALMFVETTTVTTTTPSTTPGTYTHKQAVLLYTQESHRLYTNTSVLFSF